MKVFTSSYKYIIEGRGTAFALTCPAAIRLYELLNSKLEIDGIIYTCHGVERFTLPVDRGIIAADEKIGILVEDNSTLTPEENVPHDFGAPTYKRERQMTPAEFMAWLPEYLDQSIKLLGHLDEHNVRAIKKMLATVENHPYLEGMQVRFLPGNENTGPSTSSNRPNHLLI